MRRTSRSTWAGVLLALGLATGSLALGQGSDAALRDRVARLVEKLEAPKVEARDAAEKTLIGLGAKALAFVPEPAKADTADRKARLDRIRAALREAAEQTNLGPSKVTIKVEGIRLSEAIKKLQAQSGNLITDLRDEPSNPAFDLDIADKPFFEALEEVARKGEVGLDFFTGDGTIGLTEAAGMQGQAAATPAAKNPFITHPGPFRVVCKSVSSKRDFETGGSFAVVQLDVNWEPRLRPMLMALKSEDVKVVDDRGKEVKANVDQESSSVALKSDNPSAEVNINLDLPDREAKRLGSLKVKAEVTVPAAMRTFRFPSLARAEVTRKQGEISVTFDSAEVEEQTWKVNVSIAYPGGGDGAAFESFRQGLFNNRIWLQRADGSRFEHNGGYNQTGNEGGKLSFEYLFVDAPGKLADYQLIYETPSKVVPIPLEFEFKDVPLP